MPTALIFFLNREKRELSSDIERLNEEKKNAAAQIQQLRSDHSAIEELKKTLNFEWNVAWW